jgi:hypothetical protein
MTIMTTDLTLDQLWSAIERLPLSQKATIKKKLDAEFARRLDRLLTETWADNLQYTEEEVEADVAKAIEEVRAERRAKSRR